MITSKELELQANLTLGTLESNAVLIKDLVLQKLEEYTPANYEGRAEEAKQDRAVLNNAEKALNAKRLELERSYMEPFNKFKTTITETCKAIKQASSGLDEIVKAEEERERAAKFDEIQDYWNSTGFSLFDISKVFNPKWTNKTTKLKDVQKEIDQIQARTFNDLQVLDRFPPEDVALLKTVYLETLDLSQAMARADQLKINREALAREKVERQAIQEQQALKDQRKEELQERYNPEPEKTEDLASLALGLEIQQEAAPEKEAYALLFQGTREQLLALKEYMTKAGITYTRLVDKGNDVYSTK